MKKDKNWNSSAIQLSHTESIPVSWRFSQWICFHFVQLSRHKVKIIKTATQYNYSSIRFSDGRQEFYVSTT